MDFYTVKLKIQNEIANSTSLLSPMNKHVSGNWHIQTWDKQTQNFPLVTVRMSGKLNPMWSRRTPTLPFAEVYAYDFSLFVFADSMHDSRAIADMIIDHFQMNNKFADVKIIDVVDFNSKESPTINVRRYWRTIVGFTVLTEEKLTPQTIAKTHKNDVNFALLGVTGNYNVDVMFKKQIYSIPYSVDFILDAIQSYDVDVNINLSTIQSYNTDIDINLSNITESAGLDVIIATTPTPPVIPLDDDDILLILGVKFGSWGF
jgi:hypothetical protein